MSIKIALAGNPNCGKTTLFNNLTVGHKDQAVADFTGKTHLMRHDDHRHAVICELLHDVKHFLHHFRVKGRRGLVKQHDFGVHRERTGDSDTLLLTAGKVLRINVRLILQTHHIKKFKRLLFSHFTAFAADPHRSEHDVLKNSLILKQVEVLEHHADFSADPVEIRLRLNLLAIHPDFA